jgi:restriction system protein
MLPVLKLVSDTKDHPNTQIETSISDLFKLSDDERQQTLPSGRKRVVYDRVNWARYYLLRAGLVEFPKRGLTRITSRGLNVLTSNPVRIDDGFLSQYAEFAEFKERKVSVRDKKPADDCHAPGPDKKLTPEETLQYAFREMTEHLVQDLLHRLMACSPSFFEEVVVDLLVKMGYGGSREDAAQVLGKSGDEGVDGSIKEDPLGLDFIYVQAKRWVAKVGRPDLHKFVGALHGQNARKGVFITTSEFTTEAESYAAGVATKIVLIDGNHLASLMIRYNVGVSTTNVYELKRIDSDYFGES